MIAQADRYVLRSPHSDADWHAYHAIRRDSIFATYRPEQIYDPHHPDETKSSSLPHVLAFDDEIVGTVRIDLLDDARVAFRLIAIRKDVQGRGHGRMLLQLAEAFVRQKGRRVVALNSTIPALCFYLANGYSEGEWHNVESGMADVIRVGKYLL
jgi:GNAT superfamily N-acetyltransferase